MDKVEQYKAANATNDAVVDDVASKAYVENFALETFNKGDEAQRTNKVNKQTADTFQAAATFMELLNIWSPLGPEIQAKVKYAKFHALRIAKAYKAGEDPNATNPVVEEPKPEQTGEDGLEEELRNMENDAGVYKQPTVESAPDSAMPSRPHSTLPEDRPVLPTRAADERLAPQEPDISPIEPADNGNSRAGSVGGGYFPSVPDAPSNVNSAGPIIQPPSSTQTFTTSDPADFYSQPQQPSPPQPSAPPPEDLERPSRPTPHQATLGPAVPPIQSPPPAIPSPAVPSAPPFQAVPPPVQAPPLQSIPPQTVHVGPPPGGYKTDDDSIMAAQKHAKWAISALNFEDVNTAVKELRIALQNLGAG